MATFHDSMGRIGGVAVVDVAGTLLGAYFLARYYEWHYVPTACGLLVIGEVVHVALGIETPVTKYLNG